MNLLLVWSYSVREYFLGCIYY